MKCLATVLSIAASVFVCLGSAFAADEGLYDPLPPAGSAFVRFVNAGSAEHAPAVNGKQYDAVDAASVTAYFVVKGGAAEISAGDSNVSSTVDAGKFYTAVLAGDAVQLLEDAKNTNRAKALLVFYNLTEKADLSLKTADGKVSIVGPVAPDAEGSREVNALKVGFAVYAGDVSLATLDPQSLDRGNAYAVLALPEGDGVKLVFAKAATDTKK